MLCTTTSYINTVSKSRFILSLQRFSKFLFIYLFREGREGEREEEKHQCVVAARTLPTGDPAHNPCTCPDWESNQRLWFTGRCSIHWATQARADFLNLLIIRDKGREINTDLLFYFFMDSLVASYMCPDQRSNTQPWCTGTIL